MIMCIHVNTHYYQKFVPYIYPGCSRRIVMKGYLSPASVQRIYKRFSKFAYVDVCNGKCVLTSCERVIQKKTLNPFYVNTIRLDALLQ